MAQTMKNKASWLALVAPWFLVSGGMFAQTDVVIRWVDEQGKSASQNELAGIVLHVSSWLDGVTRDAVQSEVLVVDSAGWCQWPQVADGVYNLEALPWSWTVVVEGWNGSAGIDSLTLIWPNEPIAGLRGNPADVIYPANHPGSQLARLDRWSQYTLDSLDLDQLMVTGAVGGNLEEKAEAADRLAESLAMSDSVLQRFLTVPAHTLWGDLMEASIRSWRMSLGSRAEGEVLKRWLAASQDSRSWKARLRSPGWCSVWAMTHDVWWNSLEEERRPWRSWVATGDVDSLRSVTGWSLDELHVAMWMGTNESWSRWAESWWELRWTDDCDVAQLRRQHELDKDYVLTAQAWGDERWMTPSGELSTAWAGDDEWCVWLVVRSGSIAGLREWALLRNWMDNQAPRGVTWGVLSVDASEEGWANTLSQRQSTRERLRWVGRNPSWWDRLDLTGVPQVVVVRPDGEIQSHHAPLPSNGLFAQLKRWQITAR